MSSAEEISCLALIERIKKDHMTELEEQEDLFKEARQEASEFKKTADTMEWYIAHFKAECKRALEGVEALEAAWPNLTRRGMPQPGDDFVWTQTGTKLSADQVETMEADRASFNSQSLLNSLYLQAHRLKLPLNKAAKNKAVPFRVLNHMQLTIENDIRKDTEGISVYDSSERLRAIKDLKRVLATCDVLRDTLWDKSLTLPIVHPNKRRRV